MSAVLTSETGNTDKVVKYINECREMGIRSAAARRQYFRVHLYSRDHRRRAGHSLRPWCDQERRQAAVESIEKAARAKAGRSARFTIFANASIWAP